MEACAAVPITCVAPCGAITCILRQCVHNKDDHNEDDYNENNHIVFPFQFSARGGTHNEGIQCQKGRGVAHDTGVIYCSNVYQLDTTLFSWLLLVLK